MAASVVFFARPMEKLGLICYSGIKQATLDDVKRSGIGQGRAEEEEK